MTKVTVKPVVLVKDGQEYIPISRRDMEILLKEGWVIKEDWK